LWIERKFAEMYKENPDPWGCERFADCANNEILLMMIEKRKPKKILDIGCGHGSLTERIYKITKAEIIGIDCVDLGWKNKKRIQYRKCDIMTDEIDGKYDVVIMSEILWYICEKYEKVLDKIKKILNKDGCMVIKQYFPKHQKYFAEYIDGLKGFMYYMRDWALGSYAISATQDGEVLIAIYSLRRAKHGE